MIDAKTKLFGLLGNPVGHSMSPFMHNIFLQQCGINGVYLAFAVESGQVGAAMQGMYALGVQGCNVTIPHKEAVIPYLCGMSKAAEACGAVNTLIYTPEGYYGDNTDGAGLLAALEVKRQDRIFYWWVQAALPRVYQWLWRCRVRPKFALPTAVRRKRSNWRRRLLK